MSTLYELIFGVFCIGITYVPGRVFGAPLHPRTAWALRLIGAAVLVMSLWAFLAGAARTV